MSDQTYGVARPLTGAPARIPSRSIPAGNGAFPSEHGSSRAHSTIGPSASSSQRHALLEMTERELARQSGAVPILPQSSAQALTLASSPDMTFDHVEKFAVKDPPFSGRLFSIANSALYSRGARIASVRKALVRIGMAETRDLLRQTALAKTMAFNIPGYSDVVQRIFLHCVIVAEVARELSRLRGVDTDVAYLAGLFHDVGRARALRVAVGVAPPTTTEAEIMSVVDTLHARVGSDLATHWNLPAAVSHACAWHHAPASGPPIAQIVATADVLAHSCEEPPTATDEEVTASLVALGVMEDRHARLRLTAKQIADKAVPPPLPERAE